jgi:lipopolysaccharide transport system permease protein/teichoic acid transport system permease protein
VFNEIKSFFLEITKKRETIKTLAIRNIKIKHSGSFLGFFWIYFQPILFILILYFVCSVGLKTGNSNVGAPFVVYLSVGIVAWSFFADCFGSSPKIIQQHAYMIKKVNFRLSILPIVNLIEKTVTHIVLVLFVLIISVYNGFIPSWYWWQILYYYFAMSVLLLGLNLLTSSTNLFVKDVSNVVSIIVQFGFWITPIFWGVETIPEKFVWVVKLNPMYYIIDGYRDCLIYNIPFWQKPYLTLYFWCMALLICFFGAIVFRKLRPHFAEVA